MDDRNTGNKTFYSRQYMLPTGFIPEGHIVTDGGWVVPAPATADDVRQAALESAAELRRQIETLRAELARKAAPPSSSATEVTVGENVARPVMLDVKACAMLLGISVRSWQRLVERGEAPKSVKLGKSSRWRHSDVEAFVASRR